MSCFHVFPFHLTKNKQWLCIVQEINRNVLEEGKKDTHLTVPRGQLEGGKGHFERSSLFYFMYFSITHGMFHSIEFLYHALHILLSFYLCTYVMVCVLFKRIKQNGERVWSESHLIVSDSLWPHGLYSPWNSPGQNTGVGSLSLLQGIFPTQGSNPGFLCCGWILYQLSYQGSRIRIKEAPKE